MVRKFTRVKLDAFIRAHASDARTLDLGCANSPYARLFPNRVGVDIAPGRGVDIVADAHALPLPDASFAQICCTEVLEHLHTPDKVVGEMHRVLAPGGKLILTTRFVFPIHDAPYDYYRYTAYGLRHLFREWEIVSLEEEADTFETFSILLQRLTFQSDIRGGRLGKLCFYVAAGLLWPLRFLIGAEYGMGRTKTEKGPIMTSGYYLIAKKR